MNPSLQHLFQELINFTKRNRELETNVLIIVVLLMTPLLIFSLSPIVAGLCQLIYLGVMTGLCLLITCMVYSAYLRFIPTRYLTLNALMVVQQAPIKCTIGDLVLSVIFQTGVRIPPVIWDGFMSFVIGGECEDKEGGATEEKNVMMESQSTPIQTPVKSEVDDKMWLWHRFQEDLVQFSGTAFIKIEVKEGQVGTSNEADPVVVGASECANQDNVRLVLDEGSSSKDLNVFSSPSKQQVFPPTPTITQASSTAETEGGPATRTRRRSSCVGRGATPTIARRRSTRINKNVL